MKDFLCGKKFNFLYSLLAVALMWAAWLIAGVAVQNEFLVAPFAPSAREFFALFSKAFFWKALGRTLLRTIAAFAISFAAAIVCACLSAILRPFSHFMRPIAALFRSLPTMAVLLLILVWLTPSTAPVAVAILVLFPMIYSQLYEGISGVDGELLQMAKVYNLSAAEKLKFIYLPHIMPSTVENTGVNLSFGLKIIISAEVMASTYTAIGGMMSEAQIYINLPRLAALTLVAVLFGIIIEVAFSALARTVFKWKKGAKDD